ncbi:unnamed protein product [Ostreobium quekettii]|uniref:RING-type E3 ubiquitin transferase n=1 Tax=Ostreobium quekettii TaxID=121088 RepID=A0A8S1JHV8_9CHLO|nr:unnamed protein product [Ostreobium quekettii]|eukprot:evm.model.scf_1750.3 EVM.evm.TU.scf_1750.3   scf_1750:23052-27355(+)
MGASPVGAARCSRRCRPDARAGGEEDAEDKDFTCPICLVDIEEARAKAVTVPCRHRFCLGCLLQWADIKRNCPVCKGTLEGYRFFIQGDTCSQQHTFPHEDEDCRITAVQPLGQSQTQVSGTSQVSRLRAVQSRPYCSRLRQSVPGRSSLAFRARCGYRDEDTSLRRRRAVYSKGLCAVSSGVNRSLRYSLQTRREEERLEAWIKREFQAILGAQDPSMLTAFVMALVRSYGFSRHQASSFARPSGAAGVATRMQQQQQQQEGLCQMRGSRQPLVVSDPVSALEPILQSRAARFWHELRCFAWSGLKMGTYDSVVQYSGERSNSDDSGPTTERHKRPRAWEANSESAQSRRQVACGTRSGSKLGPGEPQRRSPTFGHSCENVKERVGGKEGSGAEVWCREGKRQRREAYAAVLAASGQCSKVLAKRHAAGRGEKGAEGIAIRKAAHVALMGWRRGGSAGKGAGADDGCLMAKGRKLCGNGDGRQWGMEEHGKGVRWLEGKTGRVKCEEGTAGCGDMGLGWAVEAGSRRDSEDSENGRPCADAGSQEGSCSHW